MKGMLSFFSSGIFFGMGLRSVNQDWVLFFAMLFVATILLIVGFYLEFKEDI